MEIFGADGNGALTGTPVADVINGGEGNDVITELTAGPGGEVINFGEALYQLTGALNG